MWLAWSNRYVSFFAFLVFSANCVWLNTHPLTIYVQSKERCTSVKGLVCPVFSCSLSCSQIVRDYVDPIWLPALVCGFTAFHFVKCLFIDRYTELWRRCVVSFLLQFRISSRLAKRFSKVFYSGSEATWWRMSPTKRTTNSGRQAGFTWQ